MKTNPTFKAEYLFSGALVLAALVVFLISIFNLDKATAVCFLGAIANDGIILEGIGLLLIVSLAYPIGYTLNIFSFRKFNRLLGRRKIYKEFNKKLRNDVKEKLDELYESACNVIGDNFVFKSESRYLGLIKLLLQKHNYNLWEVTNRIYSSSTRFSRVFFLAFLAMAIILATAWALNIVLNRNSFLWSNPVSAGLVIAGLVAMALMSREIYRYALRNECIGYLMRYVLVFRDEIIKEKGASQDSIIEEK